MTTIFRRNSGESHPASNVTHRRGQQHYQTVRALGGFQERIPTRKDPDSVTFVLPRGVSTGLEEGCSLISPQGAYRLFITSEDMTEHGTFVTAFTQ